MSKLLDTAAVGQRTGEEAREILGAYIATAPLMVLNHTSTLAKQPKGTGAGDHLVEPK